MKTPERQKAAADQDGRGNWEWYTKNIILNDCLHNHPGSILKSILDAFDVEPNFDVRRFYFCLTGMKKSVYYPVFGLDAKGYMELYYEMERGLLALIKERGCCGNVFLVFEDDCKQIAIVFTPAERCPPRAMAEEACAYVQRFYEERVFQGDGRYCNFTALSAGLSGLSGIREGFLKARSLSDLSFFLMEPVTITQEDVSRLKNDLDYRRALDLCRELDLSLVLGDSAAAVARMEALFLTHLKHSFSFALVRDVLSFIRDSLNLHLTVYGIIDDYDLERLCALEHYIVIEECLNALMPAILALCGRVQSRGVFQMAVQRAIYFIRQRCKEDITLPMIAQNAGVSPNYLSGIFTRETGIPLRDYITRTRMERARELLLATGLHVYQIAGEVGIRDPKYFSRLFKDFSGLSPLDYRRLNA